MCFVAFCRRLKPPALTPPQSQSTSQSLSQSPVNGTIRAVTAATDNTRLNTATDCARLMFPSLHCPSRCLSLSFSHSLIVVLLLSFSHSFRLNWTQLWYEARWKFCCVVLRPTRKLQLNCAASCRLEVFSLSVEAFVSWMNVARECGE